MMKIKGTKRLIVIGAITLVTVLVWVALDSYRQLVKQEQFRKVSDLIEPLDPRLNTKVLDQIEARKEYRLDEIERFLLPITTPIATASPGLELIEEVEAPGGVTTESGIRQ